MDSQIEDGNPLMQAVARIGYKIWEEIDLVQMYSHLLVAALFPIYIGAHASLRCPPSVTKEPKKKRAGSLEEEDDDDDDLEEESNVEGLTPSDAIMFPVLAGFTLAGLYFLIQWLKDPKLLNKILGWYFSLIGVFGVGKLAGDCLNVATTFIFPSVWSDGKDLYHIDSTLRRQIVGKQEPFFRSGRSRPRVSFTANKMTPLPGFLSKLEFSEATNARIWAVRSLFNEKWAFVGYVRGLVKIKSRVRFNDIIGLCIGLAAIILYNLTGKAWWLTNLMAFGFCYGTLQLMSPTTFWTGSLVLMGLFVYDVVMVFYTPLMVTVATSLDVPIKLVFPGPKRGGMLGLGDVVLPGIMVALALRFDLYMHYQRLQHELDAKHRSISLQASNEETSFDFNGSQEPTKPVYKTATGFYGERFWTSSRSLIRFPISFIFSKSPSTVEVPESINGGAFKKTYFYASIVGYVIGMLVTLLVLNVYNHAQPALLYLVPGVLGALWGTSFVRGEFKDMWQYTEDGSLDDGSEKTADDVDEKVRKEEDERERKALKDRKDKEENGHRIFLFSLSTLNRGPRTVKALERKST